MMKRGVSMTRMRRNYLIDGLERSVVCCAIDLATAELLIAEDIINVSG